MKKDKQIERLREDLAEMTRFNDAGREMLAKAESKVGFLTARCEALETTILTLSRLLTGSREYIQQHTTWTLKRDDL